MPLRAFGCRSNQLAMETTLDLPPTLYHYTSWSGLEGIITTGMLWVTHLDGLNDSEELKYAQSLLCELVPRDHGHEDCVTRVIKEGGRLRHSGAAALSEEGDLLSQWRAYADDGQGVSIGFSARRLQELCEENGSDKVETWRLQQIVYEPAEQVTRVARLVRDAQRLSVERHQVPECKRCDHYAAGMEQCALSMKAPDWREEREWRLGCLSSECAEETRKSTSGPRMALAFRRFPKISNSLLIDRIIVGPKIADRIQGVRAAISAMLAQNKKEKGDSPRNRIQHEAKGPIIEPSRCSLR